MNYQERTYRQLFAQKDMVHFQVRYKETDLDIGLPRVTFKPETIKKTEIVIRKIRKELEEYIVRDPFFSTSLEPYKTLPGAPPIVEAMALAANLAGVGPMAAVAGAVSQYTARQIASDEEEIIVENGGDIYIVTKRNRTVGIFAGSSVFSHRLAIRVEPDMSPLGICTSSGTVGPSLSFGNADAAVILAENAPLADAVATAAGNLVQMPEDVEKAATMASTISGVMGAVIIAGDRMAVWGRVDLVRI